MPGFDQTGPMGQGPMTGGRRGVCANVDGAQAPDGGYGVGRGGRPRGGGRGRCFGGGRGGRRGFGRGFSQTGAQGVNDAELGGDVQSLSDEVKALRAELEKYREREANG